MIVNDENYLLLAIHHYQGNLSGGMREFEDDLKRVHYIKRLIRRFQKNGEVPVRLLLNHYVILYNTFGNFATIMLWHRMPEMQSYHKPFLAAINRLPTLISLNGNTFITSEIQSDEALLKLIQEI